VSIQSPSRATTQVDIANASVGDLFGEISRDMSTLVRQEVQLAKAELQQETKKAGKAAGMFGGAGLAGFLVLLFVSFAAWWGLANVMDQGWAALIVAAIWAVIGAVLFTVGRNRMRQVRGLPQTAETVRAAPTALTGH
jgi:hypothetical protein